MQEATGLNINITMPKSIQAWFLLLLSHFVASDDPGSCVYKVCFCLETTIDCENLHLTEIPQTNATNFTGFSTLDFTYNEISIIRSGSLPPNMTEISLQDNPVASIDDSAFEGSSSTLQSLEFSHALFQKIPDALLRLDSLKSLTVAHSKIEDWNEDVMIQLGRTLTFLNLENVSLTSWPTWIQHLPMLTDLSISSCLLTSMPDDALDSIAGSLVSLLLSRNRLTSVPKALSKLTALQTLYINNNMLVDVSWLPQKSPLTTLILNNNHIKNSTALSTALRPYGNSLTDLEIKNNQLTSIPDCSFLILIENWDFSHNRISDPYSGSVNPNITSIDLSYNALQTIPPVLTTLQQMNILLLPWNDIKVITSTRIPTWITELELGFNLVSVLTDNSFPQDSQLVTLHLNNNPIVEISNLAFKSTPMLRELNLQGTRLKRLPIALGSISGLTYFDMSNISQLVCTCMESSLKQWILSQSSGSVVGNCGETSIYDFFSKLSSACP
ncbi:hypothetical protein BsWGS_23298 [Bradybaena similaris]